MLSKLVDQAIAQVINTDPRWMEEYVIYRELGHHSAFGEESLSDLTELQLKLLSITHTYDVIQSSLNTHDSYEGGTTEIPDKVRPYPTNLLKWYKKWTEETRKKSDSAKKDSSRTSSSGRSAHTVLRDDESDADALAAYAKARLNKTGR